MDTFNLARKDEWLSEEVQAGVERNDLSTVMFMIDRVSIEEIIRLDGEFELDGNNHRAVHIEDNGPFGYFVYDEHGTRYVAFSNPRVFLDMEDAETLGSS